MRSMMMTSTRIWLRIFVLSFPSSSGVSSPTLAPCSSSSCRVSSAPFSETTLASLMDRLSEETEGGSFATWTLSLFSMAGVRRLMGRVANEWSSTSTVHRTKPCLAPKLHGVEYISQDHIFLISLRLIFAKRIWETIYHHPFLEETVIAFSVPRSTQGVDSTQ